MAHDSRMVRAMSADREGWGGDALRSAMDVGLALAKRERTATHSPTATYFSAKKNARCRASPGCLRIICPKGLGSNEAGWFLCELGQVKIV